jgi:hypothetical protein
MMDLTENDKEFLEKIGKQLGPEPAPWDAAAILIKTEELQPVMDKFYDEAVGMIKAGLVNCPNLAKSDVNTMMEMILLCQMMFIHGFIRAWQTRDHNDQA